MFIEKIKEFYPEMKAIREDLHRHPELSYQEVRTSAIVIEKLKEYGVDETFFWDSLDEMCEKAFDDQCTGANPRYPLISEIKEMFVKTSGFKSPKAN